PVHPCFFYESVWCLLGFVILAFWSKRRKYDGQIFLMYLAWYGAERFVVEGLRTDSLMLGNIRISQALSAIIFVASVILQIVLYSRKKRDPESMPLYVNTEESHHLIEESRRKKMGISGDDAKIDGINDADLDILNDDDDDFDESELDALNDDDDDFDDDDDNETSVKLVGVSENKKDDTEDEESDENKEDK
ncbi:MAG: prolipoprotein diacylglyceryl transferase, partial [Ruminococcus sp.]|nr:prolipoprotein diacylglyceryl transferase [Ruminococcus sp.]